MACWAMLLHGVEELPRVSAGQVQRIGVLARMAQMQSCADCPYAQLSCTALLHSSRLQAPKRSPSQAAHNSLSCLALAAGGHRGGSHPAHLSGSNPARDAAGRAGLMSHLMSHRGVNTCCAGSAPWRKVAPAPKNWTGPGLGRSPVPAASRGGGGAAWRDVYRSVCGMAGGVIGGANFSSASTDTGQIELL